MDYSTIVNELNTASLFELYRLNVAINQQLEDPSKLGLIKDVLKTGELVRYFDDTENRLIDATILELKKSKILVKNTIDGNLWNIPYYCINIDAIDTDIQASPKQLLNRNNLKVGDKVCFKERKGNELFGEVIKLNPKTAGVLVGQVKWKVTYRLLKPIIDGELGENMNLIEGEVLKKT